MLLLFLLTFQSFGSHVESRNAIFEDPNSLKQVIVFSSAYAF